MAFDVTGNAKLESAIEGKAVRLARKQGWLAFKMGLYSAGWPDRLFLKSSVHVWIEFKRPGKVPTPLQRKRHIELQRQGASVHVCDTWEDCLAILHAAERQNWYPGAEDL